VASRERDLEREILNFGRLEIQFLKDKKNMTYDMFGSSSSHQRKRKDRTHEFNNFGASSSFDDLFQQRRARGT